ncbi:MAG: nuclease [Bacteroidia bacterium]|nr:nuclease [Bacteroidia bacterium]
MQVEEQEQKALVQWLKLKKIFHFAPMNENKQSFTNPKVAMMIENKAKSMGKVKGVSDLIVMLPNKILFIELKRKEKSKAKVSYSQNAFLSKIGQFCYAKPYVCYGAKEAIEVVEKELKNFNQ